MTVNEEILIVSDTHYEMENIQALLRDDYGQLLKTSSEADGLKLFKKHHPKLVILAYDDIQEAKTFYLSLYENDPNIHKAPHKSLLLCRGQQSEDAYRLCYNGIIDDYVADRPMFDPHRLKLSVRHAIENHDAEQNSFWFIKQIEKLQEDVAELNNFVLGNMYQMESSTSGITEQFESYVCMLKRDVRELEKQVSPLFNSLENEEDSDSAGFFTEAIETLEQDSIEKGSEKVTESVQEATQQTTQLHNDLQSFLNALGKKDAPPKTKVLIVDDDPMYLEILSAMIEADDLHLETRPDGRAALNYLNNHKPDIIFLDYLMPVLNGLTVLKHIKTHPDLRDIPVVMLTGDSSREVVSNCIQTGAAAYVIKPGERDSLLEKIYSLTESDKET